MKRLMVGLAAAALLAAGAGRAEAGLIFYQSRAAFDVANPGLSLEDFEKANVPNNSAVTVGKPIDSTTNDGVFRPGDIQKGLSVSSLSTSPFLLVLGTGTITGASKAVAVASQGDTLSLSFAPGVSAVGTDLSAAIGGGSTLAATFDVSVFGSGGALLGQTTVTELAGGTAFFGVSSDAGLITQVTLRAEDAQDRTGVDNVAFGTLSAPAVPAVPEPGTLALAGAGALCLAGYARRRNKAVGQERLVP